MSTSNTIQDRNRESARQINEEALADPNSPYVGKFIGLINGQVVVVADTLNEVGRELRRQAGNSSNAYFLEAGRDPNEVDEIWSVFASVR